MLFRSEQQRVTRSIGSPALVANRAKLDAMPAWAQWRAELMLTVCHSTADTIKANLEKWRDEATSEDALQQSEIAGSIYRASMHADMAGQLFVRTIEVPESMAQRSNTAGAENNPFLAMTYQQALD